MYNSRSGLVLGFHGCDEVVREKVLLAKMELIPSSNDYDWLGNGIYFWENNSERALHFAKERATRKNSKIKIPAVLGAVIDLGYCLDLMDKRNIDLVKNSYESLIKSFEKANLPLPKNHTPFDHPDKKDLLMRSLDCAVINYLNYEQDKTKKFESVRGLFPEGKPLYENAGFREKDHIQICIRDIKCIKGYFLPR